MMRWIGSGALGAAGTEAGSASKRWPKRSARSRWAARSGTTRACTGTGEGGFGRAALSGATLATTGAGTRKRPLIERPSGTPRSSEDRGSRPAAASRSIRLLFLLVVRLAPGIFLLHRRTRLLLPDQLLGPLPLLLERRVGEEGTTRDLVDLPLAVPLVAAPVEVLGHVEVVVVRALLALGVF